MTKIPKHRRILGENLRSVREANGVSEEQLARRLSLDPAFIRGLEAGREDVSFDTLVRLASALRITVHDLTAGN